MNKETNATQIIQEDISFVEKELAQTRRPFSLHELTEKLAYQKTASQRTQDVKKYDPTCIYEIGDSIYKEFNEPLIVSSKTVEHFKGAVVLKMINKTYYKNFNCEMMEVDYSGGGIFRKYIDYMKKTKTQVLLPSNLEGKEKSPEKMEKGEDPRFSELPMTDRDLKTLEKNLRTSLSKFPQFFNWNDYWQVEKNQVEIPEEKIKAVENYLLETTASAPTEDLVTKFLGLEPSHDTFDLLCFSLNHLLEKKYKKDFVFVSPANWGKWHLKKILSSLPDNLPLSAPAARLPHLEEVEKPQLSIFHTFPLKIYLTWREILSGGIKIPKSLNKELSQSREYIFTDANEGKNYAVYYYPSSSFFLGLKDFFANNNIPQGTSLTLERKGPTQFNFWIKKSKKKLSVIKLIYDPKEDKFSDRGEDVFTFSLPNKIIYLERDTLARLLSFYAQRDDLDLRKLLILIFKNFSPQANNFSLHYLRAYHLVDVLKQTTQEDVEKTLLNSFEFSKSEKKKGIFFYQEAIEMKEEAKPEVPRELPEEALFVPSFEEVPTEKIPFREIEEERGKELRAERAAQTPLVGIEEEVKLEIPSAPKKEKAFKKKRLKMEGEKVLRVKKSEKRLIEEKIELEESVQEAMSAIKEKERKEAEEEREEIRAKEKKEEFKPVVPAEPSFGLFAEKLKTALTKKKKEEKKK